MKYLYAIAAIALLLLLPLQHNAQDGSAIITTPLQTQTAPDIAPEIYGAFLEVIYDAYTGPFGFCAEELLNRGFDFVKKENQAEPRQWTSETYSNGQCVLKQGGYNKRGKYNLTIEKYNNSPEKVGISQVFYTTPNTAMDFYLYARSENYKGTLRLAIRPHGSATILIDTILGTTNKEWKKLSTTFTLPPTIHKANLLIYIDSAGTVEIDEASLMPKNNIFGARKEQYDLYKRWGTTIIRFPGGGIADERQAKWQGNVGDRDQRTTDTDNPQYSDEYFRFEVGYDEFIQFCDTLKAKPQLTANYGSGTPEEAAAWVEYTNGDQSTHYGSIRSNNGFIKPFNVKYWEVGNEQYGIWETGHTTAENYAARYNQFHTLMKQKDPTIKLMPTGDTWTDDWNKRMLPINAQNIDIYSVHWGIGLDINPTIFGDSLHKIAVRDGYFCDYWYDSFIKGLQQYGLPIYVPLAKTENVFTYGSFGTYKDPRTASMQHGLWSAMHMNTLIKNCTFMKLNNATVFAGIIRAGEHPITGQRIIYGGASYHINALYRNTMKKYYLPLEIQSPTYEFNVFKDYKWIDGVATFDEDSIAIALINTHPRNDMTITTSFPFPQDAIGTLYRISPPSVESYNSPENPNLVSAKAQKTSITNSITLPAHSLTVIVMPRATNSTIKDSIYTNQSLNATIVPNPAQDLAQLIIHTDSNSTTVTIELKNTLGQTIIPAFQWIADTDRTFIPVNTSVLATGHYYWTIKNPQGNQIIKTMHIVR